MRSGGVLSALRLLCMALFLNQSTAFSVGTSGVQRTLLKGKLSRPGPWLPRKATNPIPEVRKRGPMTLTASLFDDELETIQEMESDLQNAVDREDYTRAAKIRDKLDIAKTDDSLSVLQVNAAFYSAFRECDMVKMGSIWLKPDNEHEGAMVACGHPAMPLIAGRENVLQSWRDILDGAAPDIFAENVKLHMEGSMAYVTCDERISIGEGEPADAPDAFCLATNIFVKRGGQW
eukprot:CAMPEP_0184311068 /NCGR_PEP_ID=MMETSP1049-20130417/38074_1 /TAXON_ID=77928 /ORGANISM="Proteomonas sulcata, Strain CCMP704" /LENGTH=232 /DNA_ID=CAMNT_0026626075 /DNA_START=183 /DNA_END=878 /DNA_ORIENTATION=-